MESHSLWENMVMRRVKSGTSVVLIFGKTYILILNFHEEGGVYNIYI